MLKKARFCRLGIYYTTFRPSRQAIFRPFRGFISGVSIYFFENGISYPLRPFVTPPLTLRGGIKPGFVAFLLRGKTKATSDLRKDLTERQPRARGALLR